MNTRNGSSPDAHGGAGVEDPFLVFYRAHVDDLYRWVHRRCRDHALTEDIVQETFLAAARMPDAVGEPWLYTVARNRLIDVARRNERFNDRLHLVAPRGGHRAEEGELVSRMALTEALELLRSEHRIVLQLKYVDGLSVDDLAAVIGRSPKGAEALLSRARSALRSALGGLDG